MTDRQLMQAVAEGDDGAAELLVSRFRRRVYMFLLGWTGNREDAWDSTQEVLARICRQAGLFKGDTNLSAWVFRVARNLQIDRYRSRNFQLHRRAVSLEEAPLLEAEAPRVSPERELLNHEIEERVRSAIDSLPPRQKEVVQLRLLADLQLEEIAQASGLSLGGVKSTLHNALRKLQEKLIDLKDGAHESL